jgi:AraC-like DNA-binding protein
VAAPQAEKATAAGKPAFISEKVTAAHRFYYEIASRNQSRLAVVCGGWEQCNADYAINRASFPYLSVEFVAAGKGEVRLSGCNHPLSAGTVFSYGPGVSQEIRTSPEHRLRKYFVDFVGAEGRQLLRACQLEPGQAVQLSTSAEVREAFDTLIRLADSKRRDAPRLCALQLEILIRMTMRPTRSASSNERRARATFERCRQEIDARFMSFRTLKEAASACNVEASYLCRLFHRFQAERPFHYIQCKKMEWAAQRLRSSDLLIREVADELGIEGFQFSRLFKRIYGVSPSNFLRARSNENPE